MILKIEIQMIGIKLSYERTIGPISWLSKLINKTTYTAICESKHCHFLNGTISTIEPIRTYRIFNGEVVFGKEETR